MAVKELAAGAIVTVLIGGGAYTIKQTDVIDSFASDTGMSQQQATDYVSGLKDDDLVPYDELGNSYIEDGKSFTDQAAAIDCVTYKYEWESPTLSCELGRSQLATLGSNEASLGNAFIKLSTDKATSSDIADTVALIDKVNASYGSEVISKVIETASITEAKKTNSYNKATLQAALKGN